MGEVGDDHFHDSCGDPWVDSCAIRVPESKLPSRRLILDLPRCETSTIRLERSISTVRMTQRSEKFMRTGGGTILDVEDMDSLE